MKLLTGLELLARVGASWLRSLAPQDRMRRLAALGLPTPLESRIRALTRDLGQPVAQANTGTAESPTRLGLTSIPAAGRFRQATQDYLDGKYDVDGWAECMREVLHEAHAAAAPGAPDAWLARRLDYQQTYLDQFIAQVKADQVPPERMLWRAGLYGNATYHTSAEWARHQAPGQWERWVLAPDAEHCEGCADLAKKGWVPLDTLPPLGFQDCQAACRCWVAVR